MCTSDGCLDCSDVTPNPKLRDTSLKMARQSNTVNPDNEMSSCQQFPASLLPDNKNIIWASCCKSGFPCALLLIPLRHTANTDETQADTSDRYARYVESDVFKAAACTAMCDVSHSLVSLLRVLSQAPHADPDSPQQTIRTLCIQTRLWNEDSEFRE